ncbi:hypothetical protein ABIA16_004217 [Sinorhizobium fredii]
MTNNTAKFNRDIRQAFIEFFSEIITSKIKYEMSSPNYTGPDTVEQYRKNCLFALTVQPNSSGYATSVISAQRMIERKFSEYYAQSFRHRCVHNLAMSNRTKFLQPIVITCFDVEGTRYRQDHGSTSIPHYHGLVLFHHDTTDLFFRRLRYEALDDGAYRITRPHSSINSILLKNIPTENDMSAFLSYSTKYSSILTRTSCNDSPFNIYPFRSKYFPFWNEYPLLSENVSAPMELDAIAALAKSLNSSAAPKPITHASVTDAASNSRA